MQGSTFKRIQEILSTMYALQHFQFIISGIFHHGPLELLNSSHKMNIFLNSKSIACLDI